MTVTRLLVAVGGLAGAAFFGWLAYVTLQVCVAFRSNSVTLLGCKMPLSVGLVGLAVLAGAFLLVGLMAMLVRGDDGE